MIEILTGRQTDPLQEKILDEAIKNYQAKPERETFIIIPNHIKFTTEVRAINKLATITGAHTASVKNLHILSFSRLAWFFLKDQADGMTQTLDDAAVGMLLSKIVKEHQDELQLFRTSKITSGMVRQLYQTILQVYSGDLDLSIFHEASLNEETKSKLHDLEIIYDAFISEIAGRFSTKNEIEKRLNDELAENQHLSQCDFFFSDFSRFSPQENLTIKLLFKKAGKVKLAFKTRLGEYSPQAEPGDYDYVIQQTISKLIRFLDQQKLEYRLQSLPLNPRLNSAERLNNLWIGASSNDQADNVQLVKADSRYAEAYFVARTIYQQTALNKYRYRDFLILAPNLHEYETYIGPILKQNGIPYFDDLQQEMKYHPLVILIENLASMIERPLNTSAMLAIMKTQLIIPKWYHDVGAFLHDVDDLENFVLAHGINNALWRKELANFVKAETIKLDKQAETIARLDKLRSFFVTEIDSLFEQLKALTDSHQGLTVFFNFLVKNGVNQQLDEWRNTSSEAGDLQLAQQPEQVWNLLIKLLQDYLLINPDEFNLTEFFDLLISGFKEGNFSQIPSTLDAVNVSEIGMVQTSGYKQVFIIGATANNLPTIDKTPGFLSSENLALMANQFDDEHYLEDNQQLNNLDQDYQFGLALALASDRVYVTYPVLNANNESLEPSIYYQRLADLGASEFAQHDLPNNLQDILGFLTNPKASLGYLSYLNSQDPVASQELSNIIDMLKQSRPQEVESVIEAPNFDNNPQNLGPELAHQLYGDHLNVSVSQLETYYQNSFEYFLIYGLKLRKRATNELDVIQAGNYYHETFDRLVRYLNEHQLDQSKISQEELAKILQKIQADMKEEGQYQQLLNDSFNAFLFACLDKTTNKVAAHWRNNLEKSPFRSKHSELSFGSGEAVKGLEIALPKGKSLSLRGKIDRVDLAPKDDQGTVLGEIIDYKSSAKKFDLSLFYQGISLQMISYLDILAKNAKFFAGENNLELFGAFYQTVTQRVERLNRAYDNHFEVRNDKLDTIPQLKYTGIITNDPDRIRSAEKLLANPSQSSEIYKSVRAKANGSFTLPAETNFNDEEFKQLLDFDEYLIKHAAISIMTGDIELNPYRYGKNLTGLMYSDFKDIYFFDAMMNQNNYHEIKRLKKQQLMPAIRERLERKELD